LRSRRLPAPSTSPRSRARQERGHAPWREAILKGERKAGGAEVEVREAAIRTIAFSSEVDTGSREENASKQKIGASVLIQSEPKRL
jgi:hypothetical protein